MSAPQLAAGAGMFALAGAAIYLQFASTNTPEAAALDPKVKGIKRTLSNGGLYPAPTAGEKKGITRRPSGSMAVFTEGGPALGGAESGTAN